MNKNITASDLVLVEKEPVKKQWEPLFLGMKKEDIYRIEKEEGYVYGYDKDGLEVYYEDADEYWRKREYNKQGLEKYCENSNKYWRKTEYKDGKVVNEIEFRNNKYYLNDKEAILKTK